MSVAALSTGEARALQPVADCSHWVAVGQSSTPVFVAATTTLQRDENGVFVDLAASSDEVLVPSASQFLPSAAWPIAPDPGTYRPRIDAIAYIGATHVLTPAERAGWPPSQTLSLSVTGSQFPCAPNPPVITSTPGTLARTGALYTYQLQADYSGNPAALRYRLAGGPAGMTVDELGGLVQFTPAAADVGLRGVVLKVVGENNLHTIQGYLLQVSANALPIAAGDNFETDEDVQLSGNVLSNDFDPDAEALTAALIVPPAHGALSLLPDGSFLYTPDANYFGADTFVYVAEDALEASEEATVFLEIQPVNDAPVLSLEPVEEGFVGQPITMDADAADVDGPSLAFSLTTAPAGMTIDAQTGLIEWTPASGQTGTHPVTVEVSDGELGDSLSFELTITSSNLPPEFTSTPPLAATEGLLYEYSATAIDPNPQDTVAYFLFEAPEGMIIDPGTGLISWTPAAAQVGTATVNITAYDLEAEFDEQIFVISVDGVDGAPEITSNPLRTAIAGRPFTDQFSATDSDPGDTLTFSLPAGPSGMAITGDGRLSWAPDASASGTVSVTVRVTDGAGLSDDLTYDLDLVSATPPEAAFRVAAGRNRASRQDGARAIQSHGIYQGADEVISDGFFGSGLLADANANPNAFVRYELAGGEESVVDRAVLAGTSQSWGVRNFALRLSADGVTFETVLSGELPNADVLQELEFSPTQARYAELELIDNWGDPYSIYLGRLRILERPHAGPLVSLLEGGAQILAASSNASSAGLAIDRSESTTWTGYSPGPYLRFQLVGQQAHLIDHIRLTPYIYTFAPIDFEVRVSNTGTAPEDFVTVYSGSTTNIAAEHWFSFEPVLARYVELALETTEFSVGISDFRVYASGRGGPTVAFDDRSTAEGQGTISGWLWSFGDGETSSERNPVHTYRAPGTYPVTLTVTDATGLSSQATMSYEVLAGPRVDFGWAPVPVTEGTLINFQQHATAGSMPIIAHSWSPRPGVVMAGANPQHNYPESGEYAVTLTVTDGALLEASATRPLVVLDRPPEFAAPENLSLVWGQSTALPIPNFGFTGETPSCTWLLGDGQTHTLSPCFGLAPQASWPDPGRYLATLIAEENDGATTTSSFDVDVRLRETLLLLDDRTVDLGGGISEVSASLIDGFDGSTIVGRTVRFHFQGNSADAQTDEFGRAVVALALSPSSPNAIAATFAGDEWYLASSTSDGLPPAGRPALDQRDHLGREFVVMFTPNYQTGQRVLSFASRVPNFVEIEAPGVGFGPVSTLVLPGTDRIAYLPSTVTAGISGRIENKGILVRSHRELALHGAHEVPDTTDSFMALPVDVLGTDYVVASYTAVSSTYPSAFGIVAVEDQTSVTITASAFGAPGSNTPPTVSPGVPFTIVLNRLQTFQLSGRTAADDLTGTRITSNRPLAAFGAHRCTNIPITSIACDYLAEQLLPVPSWGQDFLLASLATRTAGDVVRVIAAHPATRIIVDGVEVATIGPGQFHERELPSNSVMRLETSAAAQVMQYSKSQNTDAVPSDPFMMTILPRTHFGRNYTFSTIPVPLTHHLNVIAPTSALAGMRFDGQPITAAWTAFPGGTHSVARFPIAAGNHLLTNVAANVSFAAYLYGFADYESYGHAIGGRIPAPGACAPTSGLAGDGVDNDCDGETDEELGDGADDDSDSFIDEDLAPGNTAQNLAPVAHSGTTVIYEGDRADVGLWASDDNGDLLTYDLTRSPAPGFLTPYPAGANPPPLSGSTNVPRALVYVPPAEFSGLDSLDYLAHDAALTSNTASIAIVVLPVNDSPQITSTAPGVVVQNALYTYDVAATDVDSTAISFSLGAAPAGMTIVAGSGLISWTPQAADVGAHGVTVIATDAEGASDAQTFTVSVSNLNDPPQIVSGAPGTITAGQLFSHRFLVADPDASDIHTFTLLDGPAGMTLDPPTGELRWSPRAVDIGDHAVEARVSDAAGATDSQSFVLRVEGDRAPPRVTLVAAPRLADPGQAVTLTVSATDDVGVARRALAIDGVPVPLDAQGVGIWRSEVSGAFTAVATAEDDAGNSGTAEIHLGIRSPEDTEPPAVGLSAPAEDLVIYQPLDVSGEITDDNLLSYTLVLRQVATGREVVIGAGAAPGPGNILGRIDPTALLNGLYTLRLTGEDINGAVAVTERRVAIEGQAKIGHFRMAFNDLTLPIAGIPVRIDRAYDTMRKTRGDFGLGWTLNVAAGSYETNRALGDGWTITGPPRGLFQRFIHCSNVTQLQSHVITIRLSERESYRFVMALENVGMGDATGSGVAGCVADVVFILADGFTPGATLESLDGNYVGQLAGRRVINAIPGTLFTPYQPRRVRLTTADGRIFDLERGVGITRVVDQRGNELAISASGLSHSSGREVSFTRSPSGITSITDPQGRVISYEYDALDRLIGVVDQLGHRTSYVYDDRDLLVEVLGPDGNSAGRSEYDAEGRLAATIDPQGRRIEFTHDIEGREEVIRDRRGAITRMIYDPRGKVLSTERTVSRGGAPELARTTYTYDERGNTLTEVDPQGGLTASTYDAANNLLSETDPLGRTITRTYDSRNQLLTETDPRGFTISRTYDAAGNLLSETDGAGGTTTHTYDALGNRLSTTDPTGGATLYVYDAYGNQVSETDPLGNTITRTYDAGGRLATETKQRTDHLGATVVMTWEKRYDLKGRLIGTTDAEGATTAIEYDELGRKSADVDENGRRTEYEYDLLGNLVRTNYPDGTSELAEYDENGNRTRTIDRLGRSTLFEYDELNRKIRTIFPGGATQETEWALTPVKTAEIDENGRRRELEYDAAGQLIRTIDALGGVTSYGYDASGNQTSVVDANGHTTTSVYDGANRLITVVDREGHSSSTTYDAAGRRTSETDRTGATIGYVYDAAGRMTQVSDAMGAPTNFVYDQVGNRIRQTDAAGRITRWAYDNAGRVILHTLPLGMSRATEYDPKGNLIAQTDFGMDTILYTYDASDRLIEKEYPDGTIVSFTYAGDKRATATDARGVSSYLYDLRDRLLSVTHPGGSTLQYEYDAAGNQTALHAPGGTTQLEYDAENRLVRVIDDGGGVTQYTHDAAGNRLSATHPNGTATAWTFDDEDRILSVAHTGPGQQPIAAQTYTLDAEGRRLSVVEDGGRIDYTYDAAHRLTREERRDSSGAILGITTFTYDAVGNRIGSTGPEGSITYTHDANDRLIAESGASTVTYTHDADGNLVSRTEGAELIEYGWDFENRLISVDGPGGISVEHTYDAGGVRVASAIGGSDVNYLVDTSSGLSRVIEERDGSGGEICTYTRGDSLISQSREGRQSFYHHDGLGSVRALSDEAGDASDRYDFSAFGELYASTGTTANRYLFAGEEYDAETELYHLRARYYDPAAGRFISPDPLAAVDSVPATHHRYAYAGNDPVGAADPTGMLVCLSGLWKGRVVHLKIGEHWIASGPGRVSDWSLRDIAGARVPGSNLRPDLTALLPNHLGTNHIYEIKPVSVPDAVAVLQLSKYVGILSYYDPQHRVWRPGVGYLPPTYVEIAPPLAFAHVYPPVAGIINYCAIDARVAVGVAASVGAAMTAYSLWKGAEFSFAFTLAVFGLAF